MFAYRCNGYGHGPRNDFIVGVAKGQLLPKIYKYAYTKTASIEVFEGLQWGSTGRGGGRPPALPTSSAYGYGAKRAIYSGAGSG